MTTLITLAAQYVVPCALWAWEHQTTFAGMSAGGTALIGGLYELYRNRRIRNGRRFRSFWLVKDFSSGFLYLLCFVFIIAFFWWPLTTTYFSLLCLLRLMLWFFLGLGSFSLLAEVLVAWAAACYIASLHMRMWRAIKACFLGLVRRLFCMVINIIDEGTTMAARLAKMVLVRVVAGAYGLFIQGLRWALTAKETSGGVGSDDADVAVAETADAVEIAPAAPVACANIRKSTRARRSNKRFYGEEWVN